MFKGSNIIDFVKQFDTKEKRLNYLGNIKWAGGFVVQNVRTKLGVKQSFLIYADATSVSIKNLQQQVQCFINVNLILQKHS